MSSTSELSSFAARLRESILTSEWGATTSLSTNPGAGDTEFETLALQLFALQIKHNEPYRRLCEARGARPDTVGHWTGIPAAPTSAFKEFDLSCLPAEERTNVFHSSGTTWGRPSRHYHNARSLGLYEISLLRWFEAQFQWPMANGQLAFLTPPPGQAPHSSLVHMFETIRRKVGLGASAFVGRAAEDGAWTLDLEATLERLRGASESGQPLVMLGTAFSFVHLLDYLAERDLRFELPPGSCAIETGGYKGRSHSMPKAALHALISQRLGIPPDQIVCEYGMCELSSQAYDCTIGSSRLPPPASRITHHGLGIFRFPPWARVQIVSPETGREVSEGKTGLIRVFDLANVYSVMAIQTEDLGIRHRDGFTLAGRAALAAPRGCSLMAV
jgi:Acyl-protein synthetase, LuxE